MIHVTREMGRCVVRVERCAPPGGGLGDVPTLTLLLSGGPDPPPAGAAAGSDLLWVGRSGDVVSVRGEVDLSTRDVFAGAVAAALEDGGAADAQPRQARLDLTDVRFIDVGGARALLSVAAGMRPGMQLVVHNPPRMLLQVLELAGGRVPGLTLEQCPERGGRAQRAPLVASPDGVGSTRDRYDREARRPA